MGASEIRAGKAWVEIALKGVDKAAAQLKQFGAGFENIGRKLTGFSMAIAAPMAVATKGFATLEQALANLKAAANPTAGEFIKIKNAVNDMAAATGKAPAGVADAFGALLKAGMPLEQVLGGAADAAVKFAQVGELQMGEAAETLTKALNVFSKEGLSAAAAVDILSKTADASAVSIQDVNMAFSQSASVYAGAGLSMTDLATAIGLLGNAGIVGSDAGTSLKTMLMRLSAPADDAKSLIAELGLNVRDASGHILPMVGVIAELERTLGKLDTVSQDDAMAKIFGSDAIRAGRSFLDKGAQGFQDFGEAMKGSLGVGQKFAMMNNTLEGEVARLLTTVKLAGNAIAETIGPAIRDAMSAMGGWIKEHQALIATYGPSILKGAVWAAGLGVALVAIGKVVGGVGTLITALRSLTVFAAANPMIATFMLAATAVGAVAAALGAYGAVAAEASDKMERLRQKGDEQRGVDQLRLERLGQLAAKEKLNNDEVKEAGGLIGSLTSQYGDLGITLDKTTGKLAGFTDGQRKANEAMKAAALAQITAERAEVVSNRMRGPQAFQVGTPDGNKIQADWDAQEAKLKALDLRRKAIMGDEGGAVTGNTKGEGDKLRDKIATGHAQADGGGKINLATIEDAKAAALDLAKLEEEIAAKGHDEYQREIDDIRKLYKEKIELMERVGRSADEMADATKAAADAESDVRLRQTVDLEKKRVENAEHMLELQRDMAKAVGKDSEAAAVDAELFKKREKQRLLDSGVSGDDYQRGAGLIDRIAKGIADAPGKDADDFMRQLRRQAAEQSGDKGAVAAIDAEQFRKDAAEKLQASGLNGDALAQAQALSESIARGIGDAQAKIESIGTFNSGSIRSIMGGGVGNAAEQTAKNTAESARRLKELTGKVGDLQQVYE